MPNRTGGEYRMGNLTRGRTHHTTKSPSAGANNGEVTTVRGHECRLHVPSPRCAADDAGGAVSGFKVILTPLRHVSTQIVNSKSIGRETSDRRSRRKSIRV